MAINKEKQQFEASVSWQHANLYTAESYNEMLMRVVRCLRLNENANVKAAEWVYKDIHAIVNSLDVIVKFNENGVPTHIERELSMEEKVYLGRLRKK